MKAQISTRYPFVYKVWIFSCLLAFISITLIAIFREGGDWWSGIWIPLIISGIMFPRIIRVIGNLKTVHADQQHLYVETQDGEVQVSFNEIYLLEMKTLGGIHKVVLHSPHTGIGKRIYFMVSILYPFNSRKVDEDLRQLRERIRMVQMNLKIDDQ